MCKTVRTIFQCIVVLQLRGEGPENLSRICPIVMCLFRTFSPKLENNDTSKCSSDSFAVLQPRLELEARILVFGCEVVTYEVVTCEVVKQGGF